MCYYRDFISGCQVNSRPSRSPRPASQSAAIRGSFSLSSGSRAAALRRIPASSGSVPNRDSTRRPSSAPVPSKRTAAGISPLSGRMGAEEYFSCSAFLCFFSPLEQIFIRFDASSVQVTFPTVFGLFGIYSQHTNL